MADDIVVQNDVQESQSAASAEIDQMMKISLNNGLEPEAAKVDEPIVKVDEPVTQPLSFDSIKTEFGYNSVEDAINEIKELRILKENPTKAEIKYENEQSEKLAKALQAGKLDEVYSYLNEVRQLDALTTAEVTKDNAADIIKLGMQLKYKDLTPQEINYKFNKQFALPKEPKQNDLEEDADFEVRKAEWKEQVNDIEMSKVIEAKLARPELESAKTKIVLPEIDSTINEEYNQLKQSLEVDPKVEEEILKEYTSFTPKSIETKINFNDEANKIAFEFQYEPSGDKFEKAREMGLDINKFFGYFKKSDGTPDRQKFLDAMYLITNKEDMLIAAMNQAKNATIKSMLPDNQGGQRQIAQHQEPSELDRLMQESLAIRR